MGAWGAGPFENDDASDWAYEFDGVDVPTGFGLLEAALEVGGEGGEIEEPDGSIAVAAAAVVAWLREPDSIPAVPDGEDAATWARSAASGVTPQLVDAALAALAKVRSGSELAELWAEADDPAWADAVDGVAQHLR